MLDMVGILLLEFQERRSSLSSSDVLLDRLLECRFVLNDLYLRLNRSIYCRTSEGFAWVRKGFSSASKHENHEIAALLFAMGFRNCIYT
jgi:hypothetical protein